MKSSGRHASPQKGQKDCNDWEDLDEQMDKEALADFQRWLAPQPDRATAMRNLRLKLEVSQKIAARRAGISASEVSRIEQGARWPERDSLIALLMGPYMQPVAHANLILMWYEYAPIPHARLAIRRNSR